MKEEGGETIKKVSKKRRFGDFWKVLRYTKVTR